jgi:hypothetical protein
LGGAAAAKGQSAINALDMGRSSFGFDRVRSRPAKIIKGAKKAAYYPKILHSPQNLARRLASSFFLPAASSYHEVLTVAQQAESNAARAEAEASRPDEGFCHAAPRLSLHRLFPPPYPSITFFAEISPTSVDGVAGRDDTPAAHSVRTRRATMTWTKRRTTPPPGYLCFNYPKPHLGFSISRFFMYSPYHNAI